MIDYGLGIIIIVIGLGWIYMAYTDNDRGR